jgi:hypothetical protein
LRKHLHPYIVDLFGKKALAMENSRSLGEQREY